MNNRMLVNGIIVLCLGLFASAVSSFLEYFKILGALTHFTRGVFYGLSAVAFGVAIYLLVQSQRSN